MTDISMKGSSYRRCITQIGLTTQNLPKDTAHDFATSCLWEISNNPDPFRGCERPDRFAQVGDQFLFNIL